MKAFKERVEGNIQHTASFKSRLEGFSKIATDWSRLLFFGSDHHASLREDMHGGSAVFKKTNKTKEERDMEMINVGDEVIVRPGYLGLHAGTVIDVVDTGKGVEYVVCYPKLLPRDNYIPFKRADLILREIDHIDKTPVGGWNR